MTSSSEPSLGARYIETVKRAVANYHYLGGDASPARFNIIDHYDVRESAWKLEPWARPMTLLSRAQLDLIEAAVLALEAHNIPGDYIEAGVWRGGAVALLRALIAAHGIPERRVFAADSFAGIPLNTRFRHDPVDTWRDRWVASQAEVEGNLRRLDLLDERVVMVPGLFADSLPALAGERFALIRLDSDSYDSVETSLELLYPQLSRGGIVIVDDWHLMPCKMAVGAYRERNGVTDPIVTRADNAFWVKGGGTVL